MRAGEDYTDHPFLGMQLHTNDTRDHAHYQGHALHTNYSQQVFTPNSPFDIASAFGGTTGELRALIPGEPWPKTASNAASIKVATMSTHDGTRCSDLDMVEKLAMEHMLAHSHRMPRPADGFELRRAWARVASACRRGGGNVALAHPATLSEFIYRMGPGEIGPGGCWDFCHDTFQHGWRLTLKENCPHKVNEIWTKPNVPRGVFLVTYQGKRMDCGHIALGHVSRPYHIVNDYGTIKAKNYSAVVEL